MGRLLAFFYGVVCYAIFLGTFLYAVGFVTNSVVPKTMDSAPTSPFGLALLIDVVLLSIFAIQHSLMARQGFKKVWTKIIPSSVERSTYVLFSSLALLLLFWKWEPLGGSVWDVQNESLKIALQALGLVGWVIVLTSSFAINHFDLFGLRQVYYNLLQREYKPIPFRTPTIYNYVRHPLYFGFLLAFWATPTMTRTHLVFAVATLGYILIGIHLEEKDLVNIYGDTYRKYKKRVSMIVPLPSRDR